MREQVSKCVDGGLAAEPSGKNRRLPTEIGAELGPFAVVRHRHEGAGAIDRPLLLFTIELNPNYATGHQWYSHYLLPMRRVSESLAASRRALELDPLSVIINLHLGWHYLYAGDCDRAIAQLEKTLELDANFALARLFLGQAYEQKGKFQEAILQFQQCTRLSRQTPVHAAALAHAYAISGQTAEAEQLLDELKLASKQRFVPSYEIAVVYAGLKQNEQALDWLEKAFEQRDSGWLVDSALDPRLASLRPHPRFIELLKKMRMPSI